MSRLPALPLVVVVLTGLANADDRRELEFFESKVRPILAARCLECHGADVQKGGLRLDSGPSVRQGGDSGPAVEPGEPDESLLIEAIGYRGDIKMPPKSRLPAAEIATLREWVRRGAAWPAGDPAVPIATSRDEGQFTAEQKAFWAFQPVADPPLPAVTDRTWCQSPIDRFVLAELERHGLSPAPAADRRTLIRRATFDLTGLPPTPEEIAAFLADDSPDAFARVVDRLLASPRYGERWGRHWLDLARYADSNGLDENLAFANAFRYRDYVIAAFNADKPYDRFVQEQIAGDLMPGFTTDAERLDALVATGFLALGAKMLAEDDPVKMQMDIIDEQVDTIGRTFLGLTLGCARCHDHKFDPVGMDDYYGLAGIFKSTKTMENFSVVARWQERPLASAEAIREQQKQLALIDAQKAEAARIRDAAFEQILAEERRHVGEYLSAVLQRRQEIAALAALAPLEEDDTPLKREGAILREAESYDRGNVLKDFQNYGSGIGVLVNRGELPNVAEYDLDIGGTSPVVYLVAVRLSAADARPFRLFVDGETVRPDAGKHVTGSWTPESQKWSAEMLVTLSPGRHTVRLERAGPFPHIDKLLLTPTDLPPLEGVYRPRPELVQQWDKYLEANADLSMWSHWRNALRQAQGIKSLFGEQAVRRDPPVTGQGPDVPRTPEIIAEYAAAFATANDAWLALKARMPEAKTLPNAEHEALRRILYDSNGPFAASDSLEASFSPGTRQALKELTESISRLEKSLPKFPEAMAVSDDKPQDLRLHLRGSHLTLGREVPRQFLRIVAGDRQTPIDAARSGRLELAQWLTRPDHPLTARVMVNRIWQGHFGEGLVRSPDNFGLLGDRPTHPRLLDWLARRFVEQGWSIKAMHRQVLLSSTWQMSTRHDSRAMEIDPDNRLLWRMNRRRLEVEAIRDGMLVAAGTLDSRMGGSQLSTPNRAYVTSTANVNPVVYEGTRRSVYLPVVRSALYEVFQAFDFSDPSVQNGRRDVTTVAPQALFMMNSKFVSAQSLALADVLLKAECEDDAGRVRLAFERTLGRLPDDREVARMLEYLDSSHHSRPDAPGARRRAWQSFCRTLLASNEFVYVE